MKRFGLLLALLAAVLLVPGMFRAAAGPQTVTVFAASSLTDAFNALAAEYGAKEPGVKLRLNYGASSALRAQIEQGAPADLFASADYAQMRPLEARELVSRPVTFARNRLVVVTPKEGKPRVSTVRDLALPGLRLVTTSEVVPIGRYTQEALRKLARRRGFPPDFAERVNRNVVSREANVRAVLAKVELGEADAAVVYETDARGSSRVRSLAIPETANVPAEYPIATVAGRREGEGFLRFVLSPRGKAILRQHGFR